jgi:hypothetical protein
MADPAICTVENCCNPVTNRLRGLCRAHYARYRRYGDPNAGNTLYGAPERFLQDVVLKENGSGCLIWPYARMQAGYGVIRRNGTAKYVHIIACEARHGPKPQGRFEAAHSCGNPACCNPQHLRWATPRENQLDKWRHGTMIMGKRHPFTKFSDAEILQIVSLRGVKGPTAVARQFGISQAYVSQLWAGDVRRGRVAHDALRKQSERSASRLRSSPRSTSK